MSTGGLIDYISTLNLDPGIAYSEQTTRALSLNYLNSMTRNIDVSILGSVAVGCLSQPQRLSIDALGVPYEPLCVDGALRAAMPPLGALRPLVALALACILAFVLLILGKSPL